MKHLVGIIILTILSFSSHATSYARFSVSTYFENAELVARIFVTKAEIVESQYEGKKIVCGALISAEVIESFKSEAKSVEFIITEMGLNLAEEYLVFLEKGSNPISPMISTDSMIQPKPSKKRRACSKYYKGYKASWLNVSRFLTKWSTKDKKYEDWITPGYSVDVSDEDNLVSETVEIRSLLVNGKVIKKKHWNPQSGVVYPDEFWKYKGAIKWENYRALLQPSEKKR